MVSAVIDSANEVSLVRFLTNYSAAL